VPDNPLPLACVALGLAVPPMWLGARRIAASLSEDDDVAAALAPGLALAVWLLAVHVIALAFRAFVPGLVGGTLIAAALGALADHRLPPPPPRAHRGILERIAPLLAALAIAPMALGWAFHDELLTTGHWALVSEMQNGVYPPRQTTFPELELRYHYGFNVLVAAVTAVTRVSVSTGIDVVTIACFAYTWRLLSLIGDRVAGRGRGALAAALALFGGGIPLLCDKAKPLTVPVALGQCSIGAAPVNPPVISYFFQHAWTLGLPLALAAILIAIDERPLRPAARRLALVVVMIALALAQIVLFLTLTGALFAHELFAGSSLHLRRGGRLVVTARLSIASLLRAALTALAIVLVATRLHGFFTPWPSAEPAIAFRLGVLDTLAGALRWHAATYGLALPLGLLGLLFARRGRVLFAALVMGSLLVFNVLRYRLSWDIAKFATVAAIALAFGAAAILGRLFSARPRWLTAPIAALLTGLCVLAGVVHPIAFALDVRGIPTGDYMRASPPVSPEDRAAITLLRRLAKRDESVYRSPPAVWSYAPWGGLAHPWPDGQAKVFLGPTRTAAREAFLKALPADVDAYLEQRIRFLVLDPSDRTLLAHAARWAAAGRARKIAQLGSLTVFELRGRPD
jgi:hypothetical protein